MPVDFFCNLEKIIALATTVTQNPTGTTVGTLKILKDFATWAPSQLPNLEIDITLQLALQALFLLKKGNAACYQVCPRIVKEAVDNLVARMPIASV
ncbi:MAG: hypothetical protein MHM6MM_006421 [Cercozoa sp. M6MM]